MKENNDPRHKGITRRQRNNALEGIIEGKAGEEKGTRRLSGHGVGARPVMTRVRVLPTAVSWNFSVSVEGPNTT